jgi:hypothetical protein
MSGFTEIWRRVTGFARHEGGQVALIFALGLPALSMVVAGAIDLSRVVADRSRMQAIADAAALAGAAELAFIIGEDVAVERVEGLVETNIAEWASAPEITEVVRVIDDDRQRIMEVRLDGVSPSFFMNLLPPGGWKYSVVSRAVSVSQTPLCVLGTGTSGEMINLVNNSHIRAPDCGVHSNAQIRVQGAGTIEGRRIQAVLSATGSMTPSPGEGAASIVDPFSAMSFPSLNSCVGQTGSIVYEVSDSTSYLDPGIHCLPITVKNRATLVLRPGDHFFRKNIALQGHGRLEGEDVFLFFDHGSDPLFGGVNARVNLVGRKHGPYAGMVLATIGGNSPNIGLPGRNVEQLLGVVYVRNGFVEVNGNGVAAEDSAWTVIVAREIRLRTAAGIRINADYESSDVPVPDGVGPNAGGMGGNGTRLVD